MSMFENKTKPELEAGNYLVYTDEPGTVVSPGSGGGGGGGTVQTLNAHYDFGGEFYVLDSEITFNELKSAFEAGAEVHLELVQEADAYTLVNTSRMQSWDSMTGDYPSYKAQFLMGSELVELSAESPDSPMTMS